MRPASNARPAPNARPEPTTRSARRATPAAAVLAATFLAAAFVTVVVPLPGGSGELAAQGIILPERPGADRSTVVRLRSRVQVNVVDQVAQVEVEEWFENRSPVIAEGVYHYPLPGETVFDRYSLYQGDLELTGETLDAAEARAVYEAIVRSQRDPALIELVDQGLVRARVFPFAPGETRRITLRYTQLLPRSADALEFRFTAGASHARMGGAMGGASGGAGEGSRGAPVALTVRVEDGGRFLDPFSPTHAVQVEREGGAMMVRPGGDVEGRFALFLPLAGAPVRLALATHRVSSEAGYFMLTLSPGQVAASTMPRDLVVAVDVSGSMSGEKMEQTRAALLQLLGTLEPGDRFRLIRFSSAVETWRSGWTRAGPAELAEARGWVAALHANGGTNISGALEEAFREPSAAGRLPVVVFLTDGLATVGERDPERIAARAEGVRGDARVYAFGVGFDVDTYLMDRLTGAGRGSVQYVGPGEDIEYALGALAMKIRHPVLTDLELDRLPVRVRELYPTRIPDLFAGGELTLFGRYEAAGRGTLSVRGMREGREAEFRSEVVFPDHASEGAFIPRLWAARKIGELTREVRVSGPDPELVEDIRTTALRYGILTEYTSYLVLEPGVTAAGGRPVPPAVTEAPRHGADAVRAASASGRAREARTEGDLAAMELLAFGGVTSAAREDVRVSSGRAFERREGVWVDRLHDPDNRIVLVEAFSPAWFGLLRHLPELQSWLREPGAILVAGREVSIEVTEGSDGAGRTTTRALPEAELARIARAFRAR